MCHSKLNLSLCNKRPRADVFCDIWPHSQFQVLSFNTHLIILFHTGQRKKQQLEIIHAYTYTDINDVNGPWKVKINTNLFLAQK